ncbi:WW domain-containing oxidoreductase-like isoform X2 [Mytilus californianus]|uniref:WW domain-containing oxidoreductase-like isoform X2 n=1 Tax=Mytilus californianus TaxID=6549 RepID=UPI0022475FA2|nr:WW domain-containing oxidoreductase-like isoform X2 [Mytilus californianus]
MGGGTSFPREPLDRNKVVIVTGGNTGIGYETAKWIAMLGAKVIIACRSETRALEAIKRMKEEYSTEKQKGTKGIIQDGDIDVTFLQVDLASLQSTKKFIENFKSSGQKLHTLVCNAGLGFLPLEFTEDGNELLFQTNYLSQFLICVHLIPLMENSGSDDCRIIMVSSSVHDFAPQFDISKVQGKDLKKSSYDEMGYYAYSKLYQVMQMYFMNSRLKDTNVSVLSIHPGIVKTEFQRNFHQSGACIVPIIKCFICCGCARNAFKGAETEIYAAVAPQLKGIRDVYYVDCKPKTTASQSRNSENQEALLKLSLELLKDYIPDSLAQRWSPIT